MYHSFNFGKVLPTTHSDFKISILKKTKLK